MQNVSLAETSMGLVLPALDMEKSVLNVLVGRCLKSLANLVSLNSPIVLNTEETKWMNSFASNATRLILSIDTSGILLLRIVLSPQLLIAR